MADAAQYRVGTKIPLDRRGFQYGGAEITNVQELPQGFKVIEFKEGGKSYGGSFYSRQKLMAPSGIFLGGGARSAEEIPDEPFADNEYSDPQYEPVDETKHPSCRGCGKDMTGESAWKLKCLTCFGKRQYARCKKN